MTPLVTVIVPTTHGRLQYNEAILNNFIRQDYAQKHIIFDYGEGFIGTKLNRLCDKSIGEVIVRFDSDDVYSSDWITKSVEALLQSEADVVGLQSMNFYDPASDTAYKYTFPACTVAFIAGATMCFRRSFWERNPFVDLQVGEDSAFVSGGPGRTVKIYNHRYQDGFLGSIHANNTSPRQVNNGFVYRMCSIEETEEIKKIFGIISHHSD